MTAAVKRGRPDPLSRVGGESMTFEAYLKRELNQGKIDFHLRAHVDSNGIVTFLIHPAGRDGVTFDFTVQENRLVSRFQ